MSSSTTTTPTTPTSSIESVLTEKRSFPPPPEFAAQAHLKSFPDYEAMYARAASDPEGFWAEIAGALSWATPWQQVRDWKLPDARWFVGGALNVSVNCLDRHVATWRKNKAALLFEGEPGDTRVMTYGQLHREVCKAANALTALGIGKGDFVAIYMPMIPEAAVAMLACTRIGAPHTVVFGGFSSEALRDRIVDARARAVITSDGGWRRAARIRSRGMRAMSGGTTRSTPRRRRTPPRRSTASTRCSRSTPAARRASPRASCTPPAAT
jgi:acetyl-CoA synthetase